MHYLMHLKSITKNKYVLWMNCDNAFLHLFENIKHIKQCELKGIINANNAQISSGFRFKTAGEQIITTNMTNILNNYKFESTFSPLYVSTVKNWRVILYITGNSICSSNTDWINWPWISTCQFTVCTQHLAKTDKKYSLIPAKVQSFPERGHPRVTAQFDGWGTW